MSFTLHRPQSVADAIRLQAECGGKFLAGGTVLLVDRRRGKCTAGDYISLESIPELRGIRETEDGIVIGALTTFRDMEDSALLKDAAFALWQAAGSVGGPQVRNRGTIGGNIASGSPSADCAASLLALGATLRIAGTNGVREIPVTEFFLGVGKTALAADEILTELVLPAEETVSAFRKVGKRNALAISCINMAASRGANGIRVAVGAAAPTPRLCAKTSEILSGGELTAERIDAACAAILTEIAPIDDRWATAEYRRMVCVNALKAMVKEELK